VAAAREDDRRVRAALERLRPGLRRALVLTVMEGMSVEEAARAEGCVKATMYWRVHQARKVLKAELSRDEYEEHAGG
jgi:DNA-directed RNA polymerase specialized sigma24 family protein